jgi:hypothetical protein
VSERKSGCKTSREPYLNVTFALSLSLSFSFTLIWKIPNPTNPSFLVQPKNGTKGFLSPLFYFLSFFTPNAHIQSGDALTPSSSLVKFNFDVVVQNFLIMLVVIYFDYKGEVFIVRTEASKYENTW